MWQCDCACQRMKTAISSNVKPASYMASFILPLGTLLKADSFEQNFKEGFNTGDEQEQRLHQHLWSLQAKLNISMEEIRTAMEHTLEESWTSYRAAICSV